MRGVGYKMCTITELDKQMELEKQTELEKRTLPQHEHDMSPLCSAISPLLAISHETFSPCAVACHLQYRHKINTVSTSASQNEVCFQTTVFVEYMLQTSVRTK